MTQESTKDFFISYNKADRTWAEWIAWQLEAHGYTTIIQAWDFGAGSNFILGMQQAASTTRCTIAVLSPDYLTSLYTQPEWAAAFVQDPTGQQRTLLPVRVRLCELRGLFASIVYLNLIDLDEAAATARLLAAVRGTRAKPSSAPSYPGQTLQPTTPAPRFPNSFPPIWHVPYPQNPLFTGREDTLTALYEALTSSRAAALTQPRALSGLGGIGKTQLAIEYAYRYRGSYQAVLWVGAETYEVFTANLAALARADCLNLPAQEDQDQQDIIGSVLRWLQTQSGWLLILDNSELEYTHAPTAALLRHLLALRSQGDLLITTRTQATGPYLQRIPLDRLSDEQGMLFLLRRTLRLTLTQSLPDAQVADLTSARTIVQAVAGLPLALDQAGAYVEEHQCDLAYYLDLYHDQQTRRDLLRARGVTALDHPESVAVTFSLSFQQIEQRDPKASDLLRVCAFLYAEDIPEAILTEGAAHLGPQLQALTDQPTTFDHALALLGRYSLLQREPIRHTLSLHRMTQAVLQAMMEEDEQRQWAERVIEAVNATFPKIDHTTWTLCEQFLPQALACRDAIERWHIQTYTAGRVLNEAAYYLKYRFQFAQALPLYQSALAISEQIFGREHPDVATSLNNLAVLYQSQGDYAQALPLLQRALAIREQIFGPLHPDTARSLNNLGMHYETQGDYAKALPLYQRALDIREQVFGPLHPDTAGSLNNLAGLYYSQGDSTQALPLYQRALTIFDNKLGPHHPTTKIVRANHTMVVEEMHRQKD